MVVVAASLSAWLAIKQWEDRPPLNCSVDQCYFNSSALFISALISFLVSPHTSTASFPRFLTSCFFYLHWSRNSHWNVSWNLSGHWLIIGKTLSFCHKCYKIHFFHRFWELSISGISIFNSLILRTVCVCVCAVVSTLRVYCMMSKRPASNLIKKEIKVDVCYFQLRCSTAICQSQRCDCFGPTVIHCLSKY